jgi:hypothetical protein
MSAPLSPAEAFILEALAAGTDNPEFDDGEWMPNGEAIYGLGREPSEVAEFEFSLTSLVERGLLKSEDISGMTTYGLTEIGKARALAFAAT